MTKSAIQFHVFQGSLDTHPELLQRVSDVGFGGVEFAWRLFDFDLEQVGRTIDRTGLTIVGRHVSPAELEQTSADRLSQYRRLRCNQLTTTHFDEEWFADVDSVTNLASYLHTHAERLEMNDFELQYHNNGVENVRLENGQVALDTLLERLDEKIGFQLDVAHAVDGGLDPIELLEQHADRIDSIHFSDSVPGIDHSISLGQGDVDLDGVLEAAVQHDIDWVIYEDSHHNTTLEEAYERIQSALRQAEQPTDSFRAAEE